MTRRLSTHAEWILPIACGSALAGLILLIVGRDYPLIGGDHQYFVPRLLDTDLHIHLNGLTVQWYTPTFGGGLPAFANPQHLQYSVPQALTYVLNPWLAISITTAAVSVCGSYAFYAFLRRQLHLESLPSLLGAAFFLGNGFYIEHLIVGHLGFQLFPLAAVLLDALTNDRRPAVASACIAALVLALMMFHAGVYLIILIGLSLALTLLVTYLFAPRLVVARRLALVSGIAAGLFVLMAAPKLYAALALMRQFPREIADVYDVGVVQALAGFAAQLLGAMVLVPIFLVSQLELIRIGGFFSKLTGASVRVGVWELDTGLSPVLIAILSVALIRLILQVRRNGMPVLARPQLIVLGLIGITTWVLVEATLAKGFIYPHVKNLPILRSLHVNHRIAATFILPLSIVGAAAVNRWYADTRNRGSMIAAIGLALASPIAYLALPAALHFRSFDVSESVRTADRMRAGEPFDVTRIADVTDAEALATRSSSYRPYEGIFGYALETFAAETHVGSVREVRDGYFNMTNPAGLVFPELNRLRPFERIRADDAGALEAFLHRRQPDWLVPPALHVLNRVALMTLGLTLLALGWLQRRGWRAPRT